VNNLEGAIEAAKRIPQLSRERCREIFDQRFTAAQMAEAYIAAYHRLREASVAS